MNEELKACGKNGYGETFWKLCVPDEHCSPGLEVGISAGERGVTIGGRLIKWTDLDTARAQLPSQGGEAVEAIKVVGYLSHCADGYDPDAPPPPSQEPLMTVAQHQRILAASAGSAEPVAAQSRWRLPEIGRPNWSPWEPAVVSTSNPAWCVDSQGFEVEYRLLYTRPADQVAEGVVVPRGLAENLLIWARLAVSEDYDGAEESVKELSTLLANSEGQTNGA